MDDTPSFLTETCWTCLDLAVRAARVQTVEWQTYACTLFLYSLTHVQATCTYPVRF